MKICEASETDEASVLRVERVAFGEPDVAELVADLLRDVTARPLVSLLAWEADEAIGHIMFSASSVVGVDGITASILAPLAVTPRLQGRGVGGSLIEAGVERMSALGVDLVFVLGHPGYYPKHGFVPAIPLGLLPPYSVEPEDAWMVRALRPGVLGTVRGSVTCAEALDRPEHWRE